MGGVKLLETMTRDVAVLEMVSNKLVVTNYTEVLRNKRTGKYNLTHNGNKIYCEGSEDYHVYTHCLVLNMHLLEEAKIAFATRKWIQSANELDRKEEWVKIATQNTKELRSALDELWSDDQDY